MEERPAGTWAACGLGAILPQVQRTSERKLIARISRSLTSTESLRGYSQIEREALGCVLAVRVHLVNRQHASSYYAQSALE